MLVTDTQTYMQTDAGKNIITSDNKGNNKIHQGANETLNNE